MAKKEKHHGVKTHRMTSIGQSANTRPKNKSKKRDFKSYRGQGKI